PLRPEFAAWRYGGVFRRRLRRRVAVVSGGGAMVVTWGVLLGAPPMVALVGVPVFAFGALPLAFASFALHSDFFIVKVVGDDGKPLRVTRRDLAHTSIVGGADDVLRLRLRHSYGTQDLT